MNLQTWAEWVAQIDVLTGGGVVELRVGPGKGMTIAVRWAQDGQSMAYGHALSMREMKAMYGVVRPCVLESITHAVRKMTPNVEVTGAAPLHGAASAGTQGSATDSRGKDKNASDAG